MSTAFGRLLRLTVEGTSHARAIRFSLSGLPAGMSVDAQILRTLMERRAPGRDRLSTARRETDEVVFTSGLVGGVTDGSPVCGSIVNADIRPQDYGLSRTIPRPGHADFPQWVETGVIPTGGGANSGRLTAAFCAAGGICLQWLENRGVHVSACVETVGGERGVRSQTRAIEAARAAGDSVGGTVSCTVSGLPPGIGGAMFDGLESVLSSMMFAIPGVKGVEFGMGFGCTTMRGSAFNDAFTVRDGKVITRTNRQGGVLGGRTSGMPIAFRVALRPTPTVFRKQNSVDLATMKPAKLAMKGRHDPCIVRRAVPVVEALAGFAIADALLADAAAHPRICLTLTGRTLEENLEQYASQRYFVDMVELRADLLTPTERRFVGSFPGRLPKGLPAILTFRRRCDGGAFEGSEAERTAFFRRSLSGFAYVDFEDDFRVPSLERLARRKGVRIVRSCHSFDGPVPGLPSAVRKMVGISGEIAKIAFCPRTMGDVARLFKSARSLNDVPHVICSMGARGFVSRVLAGRLGSLWTYASTGALSGLGHVTPEELVRTYRQRVVTGGARLYGVTGWPLKVTRSPEINNAAWANEDEDALMVPFPSESAREAMRFMKETGMDGLAVTIPHKREIMPLLDAVDPSARAVGAVNTVKRMGARYVGYNTDVSGFAKALSAFVAREGLSLRKLRAAVLGNGGAAQAVKAALRGMKVRFTVFHRETPPSGYDLIVNATPVDPMPDYEFDGHELVYDLVYEPPVTPLLARALAKGCSVENGFSMLQAQACEQRRIWQD